MNICFSSRGSIIRNIPSYVMDISFCSRGSIIIYMNVCFSSRSCAICHIPSTIMNISLSKWIVYPSMQNAWIDRHSVRICHQPWVPVGKEKWCSCSSFLGYRSSSRQAKNCEKYLQQKNVIKISKSSQGKAVPSSKKMMALQNAKETMAERVDIEPCLGLLIVVLSNKALAIN